MRQTFKHTFGEVKKQTKEKGRRDCREPITQMLDLKKIKIIKKLKKNEIS